MALQRGGQQPTQRLRECGKERALILQIFSGKVTQKMQDLRQSDCEALKSYLLKVGEAIEFGALYKGLEGMFGGV